MTDMPCTCPQQYGRPWHSKRCALYAEPAPIPQEHVAKQAFEVFYLKDVKGGDSPVPWGHSWLESRWKFWWAAWQAASTAHETTADHTLVLRICTAYEQGYGQHGRALENPYTAGTRESEAWNMGWQIAKQKACDGPEPCVSHLALKECEKALELIRAESIPQGMSAALFADRVLNGPSSEKTNDESHG